MENKFRNEKEIKLGANTILLRPTFENIAAMESNVGSVAWLTWKFSRGVTYGADGKADPKSFRTDSAIKAIPSLSECAQIIYFNQAATKPDDPTLKKHSLEEIWQMVLEAGAPVTVKVVEFLGGIARGGKSESDEQPTESEKKS